MKQYVVALHELEKRCKFTWKMLNGTSRAFQKTRQASMVDPAKLAFSREQHGSTQGACDLPLIHPGIQTASVEDMAAINQLSNLLAFLDFT